MLKRGAGKSQVQVEKISRSKSGHPYSDPSKNKLFGSFALIYVIEGYVSITLDENNKNEQTHELKEGQTLFIERDEESDPTSFSMNATDSTGKSSQSGIGKYFFFFLLFFYILLIPSNRGKCRHYNNRRRKDIWRHHANPRK
jgi:hypothetical protein